MPFSESTLLISADLHRGVTGILNKTSKVLQQQPHTPDKFLEIQAPYLFAYHHRGTLNSYASKLDQPIRMQWELLMAYVDQAYGNEHKEVAQMLSAGMISPRFIPYLINRGDVLIYNDHGRHSACVASSEPTQNQSDAISDSEDRPNIVGEVVELRYPQTGAAEFDRKAERWRIDTQSWKLDGFFRKHSEQMLLKIPIPRRADGLIPIKELELYPIKYESPQLWSRLLRRGLQVWKSRARRYVTYKSKPNDMSRKSSDPRYMIDPLTYRKLHKCDGSIPQDDLGPTSMGLGEPPADPFLALLPSVIHGFNMRTKTWEELAVERLADVSWDKKAFENLVFDNYSKHLVLELVSSARVADFEGDFIASKGNNTIILLHGDPGTGKTLTAESVAEAAEKPLLPVTYGELGTDLVHFKRSLEQIFYFSKLWDCIIFLDSADAYSGRQPLTNTRRNALLTVLSETLEYHECTIILTSSRVDIFDQGFKSRIHYAVQYKMPDVDDRRQLWGNFITHLEGVDNESSDIRGLREHIDELAKYELTGRQISNVVSTARRLTLCREMKLDLEGMRSMIKISIAFRKDMK